MTTAVTATAATTTTTTPSTSVRNKGGKEGGGHARRLRRGIHPHPGSPTRDRIHILPPFHPPSSPCSIRNLPRRTDPRRPLIISIRFRTQAPADRSLRSAPFCLPSTGVTSFGVAASGNDVRANPRGHNDITRLVFLAFISRFIPLQRDNPPPFVSICLEWCSAF